MKREKWLFEITPKQSLFDLNLKELWKYRDLLMLFVKRDIITLYKQTILGPLWYIIQPLFTSIIFTLVFNNIGNISTNGIPAFLFNLGGITAWNYFKDCLIDTSDTFKKNEQIFGKVYFPRVIMPMSIIVSNLLKFAIQLFIFIVFYMYFVSTNRLEFSFSFDLLYLPFLFVSMGVLGLGLGMIISSMVTKYRDLTFLVSFGVQLLMYLSAVVYPVELIKEKVPKYSWVVEYNPMTIVIENFRKIVFPTIEAKVLPLDVFYMLLISLAVFILGLLIFNKTEKSFIDTI
ncbi:Teichoic acid translocation permease protein TagG [Polaribacter huanghezhanensis]|uniref:ABC transporter permease n=1 Tax=Polaribacter huanghezhanensis TaxID=1354726 RepID=UPI0026486004|nr:ABC transporter permease [Polaribacter huanghezhanensis]WKD86500.1 Teichoic acid translocation permease protein TagG [Polaribacter huanghezhanensis]